MSRHRRAAGPRVVVPPLLNPTLNAITADVIAGLRSTQPYDFTVLRDVSRLSPPPPQVDASSATRPASLVEVTECDEATLGGALRDAKRMLIAAVEEWLPVEYRSRLLPLTDIPEDDGLVSLLLRDSRRGITPRRSFEARRLLHLARHLIHLQHESTVLQESRTSAEHVWNAVGTRCLTDASERTTLHALLDPNQQYRCTDVSIAQPRSSWSAREHLVVEQGSVVVRRLRDVTGGERPILMTMRVKNPFSILIHMLRDQIPEPEWVMDIRGVRFVCFSHEDRLACLEALVDRFTRIPRTMTGWVDRYSRTVQRQLNRFAGGYFRTMKFYCHFDGQSGVWEVHIQHIHDYVNLWYSKGDENWFQYRLRQLLKLFFPRYFPNVIYGIPWHERRLHRTCRAWVKECRRVFPAPQDQPHLRAS